SSRSHTGPRPFRSFPSCATSRLEALRRWRARGADVAESMNRDLRLLAYEIGQAFGERRGLPDLIAFAVATFRELLKAQGVAILLLDRENDELYIPFSA